MIPAAIATAVRPMPNHHTYGWTPPASVMRRWRAASSRPARCSIKAKDSVDQQEAMQRLSASNERETAGTTSLGALLRAKLDNQKDNG